MLETNRDDRGTVPILELRPSRDARPWMPALVGALTGGLILVVAYLVLSPWIHGSVVSGYGVGGALGTGMSPSQFVMVGLTVELVIGLLLGTIAWWVSRSPVLGTYGQGPAVKILAFAALVLTILAIPATWILSLAAAAHIDHLASLGVWPRVLFGAIVPVAALLVFVAYVYRSKQSTRVAVGQSQKLSIMGDKGRYHLRCSACGREYEQEKLSIFTPHMPGSGEDGVQALLFLTCPRCGERGWNAYLGKPAG